MDATAEKQIVSAWASVVERNKMNAVYGRRGLGGDLTRGLQVWHDSAMRWHLAGKEAGLVGWKWP